MRETEILKQDQRAEFNDRSKYDQAFLRLLIINGSFEKVFLQIDRIGIARGASDLKVLFADIHFFLVAVTNVMNGVKSLKAVIKIDRKLNAIYKKYILKLERLDIFRDHLEHITDGRLDGLGKKKNPLKNPGMLGNLFGDDYDFGGERFNLVESFSMLDEFYMEIREWARETQERPLF